MSAMHSRVRVLHSHAVIADPLASDFSPDTVHHLPAELSQWLHLLYAYLQVEQAYADALASLGRTGEPNSPVTAPFLSEHNAQQCLCECRCIACLPDMV